jgi:hypothetical protein
VNILPHGFLIEPLDEFVPQEDVQPSSDGRYWRCSGRSGPGLLLVPADKH